MLNIKLYGKRTSSYSFVKKHITDFLLFNHLDFELIEYNNVIDFINDQVNSIPCIVINDGLKIEVTKQENIKKVILLIYHAIADQIGFRKIRKIIVPFDFSRASLTTIHQSKILLHSNHFTIQLLFTSKSINKAKLQKGEHLYSKEKIIKICEKLEEDYIGEISHITPIYSKIISGSNWLGMIERLSLHNEDIILYNYNSQLIPIDDQFIHAMLKIKMKVVLIFDSTNLDIEKGINTILKKSSSSFSYEYANIEYSLENHYPSEIDHLLNEPSYAILSRASYDLSDNSMVELVKKCLKNEVPLLII